MPELKENKYWTINTCKQCRVKFNIRISAKKQGKGKFCSLSCATTYRNVTNNPAKLESVRRKISENHADVSGKNNPMHDKRGEKAPSYVDGRSKYKGETYRKIALANLKHECKQCSESNMDVVEVHHIDGNKRNNELYNLEFLCGDCHRTKHIYQRDSRGRYTGSKLA